MRRILFAVLFLTLVPVLAYAGDLPNLNLTPGVSLPLTYKDICKTKWGKDARHVTSAMKRQVVAFYHFTPASCPSGKVEIDHLISRELGGADDVRNLWPQCYEKPIVGKRPSQVAEWGAHKKDRLENRLHKEICAGSLTLQAAQRAIRNDWRKAYIRYFGKP